MVFGKSDQEFSIEKLEELVSQNKIEESKEYVNTYFARVGNPPATVLYWSPSINQKMLMTYAEAKSTYLMSSIYNCKFNVQKWFFQENKLIFNQNVEPSEPLIYERKGRPFINLFHGYQHSDCKKYNKYNKKAKSIVNAIWNHIKDVWCSDNEKLFNYVRNWIVNMVAGRKMKTCLYNKSLQGTGKSIITDFIADKVLGRKISYTTSDIGVLMGNFNSELIGKVLLVFEELPATGTSQWQSMSNVLKHLITGSTFSAKEKYKPSYETNNYASVIINTNNNAVKIDPDDRRIVVLNFSNKYIGNRKYFNELGNMLEHDIAGEAFYAYCIANKNKFNEAIIPITETKKDLINDNMPEFLKYIKFNYVLKNKGIDVPFKDFYNDFEAYCELHKMKSESPIRLSRNLKMYDIPVLTKTHNIKFVQISKDELLKMFKDRNWLHETDEFQPDKNEYLIDEQETEEENDSEKEPEKTPNKKSRLINTNENKTKYKKINALKVLLHN